MSLRGDLQVDDAIHKTICGKKMDCFAGARNDAPSPYPLRTHVGIGLAIKMRAPQVGESGGGKKTR